MIEIRLKAPITEEIPYVTISNEELIKGILAMPDEEFFTIVSGLFNSTTKLTSRQFMITFAWCGNKLKKMNLDPAQVNVLEEYIKDFKLCPK